MIKVHEYQDTITLLVNIKTVIHQSLNWVKQRQHSQGTVIIDLTKNQVEQIVICFPGGLPYKSDAGARRFQILVSLRVFGTEKD